MNFSSDNAYGAAPEILAALSEANQGSLPSYGEDEMTARVQSRVRELFECPAARVFPVFTGTAANALALATISPPYGAVFCHTESHIAVDECAAPEFFSGGAKLVHLQGASAKIEPVAVETALSAFRRGVHSPKPAAISISQITERGTAYKPDEIAALSELARREQMALHMDGARLANALAFLGCTPAEITWQAGVDVLSLGATKNGALCAEAVVFFDPELVRDFEYRRKRAGHLASKMRFVSAQIDAYLNNDFWMRRAGIANGKAKRLANALQVVESISLAEPVEGNEIFARMPTGLAERLREAGANFYDWERADANHTIIRLVLSFLTPDEDIDRFIALLQS